MKRDHNGEFKKNKARLVAKGYAQRSGTDFNETFSPVTRMSSIRVMIASKYNMSIEIDIITAYLNGTLEEDIFMEIP